MVDGSLSSPEAAFRGVDEVVALTHGLGSSSSLQSDAGAAAD